MAASSSADADIRVEEKATDEAAFVADGKVKDQEQQRAAAEADAQVSFSVALLSGKSCELSCPGSAKIAELRGTLLEALELDKEQDDFRPRLSLSLPGSSTALEEASSVGPLAGQTLQAVLLPPEPDWCRGMRFKKSYVHGRHCGKEETSSDTYVDFSEGGTFRFLEQTHDHDAECHFSEDRTTEATGRWKVSGRAGGEVFLLLEGEKKSRTTGFHEASDEVDAYDEDYMPRTTRVDKRDEGQFKKKIRKSVLLSKDWNSSLIGSWPPTGIRLDL